MINSYKAEDMEKSRNQHQKRYHLLNVADDVMSGQIGLCYGLSTRCKISCTVAMETTPTSLKQIGYLQENAIFLKMESILTINFTKFVCVMGEMTFISVGSIINWYREHGQWCCV